MMAAGDRVGVLRNVAETLHLGTARWIDDGGGKSLTRTPHHVSTQLKTGLGEDGVVAPPAAVFRPCHSQQACTWAADSSEIVPRRRDEDAV